MLRAWRLAFAMQRLELRLLLGVAALLVLASFAIAWQQHEVHADMLACYRDAPPMVEGSQGSPCPQFDDTLNLLDSARLFAKIGAAGVPFVLGLFLGVPLVAREIEGRTAPMAWSLSRSRQRWLLYRAAPVVAVAVLAALLVGIGGEVLTRVAPLNAGIDPGFIDYGSRGALVAVRALAVLSLGIAAGTLVPCQLPALLLAGAATAAVFIALTIGLDAWMKAEAEPIAMDDAQRGARVFDLGYRDDITGAVTPLGWRIGQFGDGGVPGDKPEGATAVYIGIPSPRYGVWVLRESAVLGSLALASGALALVVVQRKRPG